MEGELHAALIAAIEHLKPGLVILDPFIQSHGLTENDNNDIDIVMTALAEIAQKPDYRCAIEAPHHIAKGGESAKTGRGASSFKDAARLTHALSAMTKDDASKLTLNEEDKIIPFLFRVDRAKVNIVPPATVATWFRLVNVAIGNADETYPSGDHVQTVERWYPPDIMSGISDAQRDAILDDLEKGLPDGQRYSSNANAKERAAWKVVLKYCPTIGEERCRAIIKAWGRSDLLREDKYKDPERREDANGIVAVNRPAKVAF